MAPLLNRSSYPSAPNPRGEYLTKVCIALTATAGGFVVFRVGIRAKRQLLGWDDLWIGIALVFSILLMVSIIMGDEYGWGLHTYQVTNEQKEKALFWWYLNQIFYKSIIWPTKVSILLMYRRVFLDGDNIKAYGVQFRTLVWVTFAVVISCYVSFETAGIFQCTPIRKSWDRSIPGDCTAMMPRMYAHAACNFILDVVILMLPMPLISGMTHISRRQRIGLMGVFAIGGFVCLTTILRISKLLVKSDILYSARDSILWTTIEANVGIICACLPLMRSVFIYLSSCFSDRTSFEHQSRNRTYEKSFKAANESRGRQHNMDKDESATKKERDIAVSRIEEERRRIPNKVVIEDDVQRRIDNETTRDTTTEDNESHTEYGDRPWS